jgi:hypothetical protein
MNNYKLLYSLLLGLPILLLLALLILGIVLEDLNLEDLLICRRKKKMTLKGVHLRLKINTARPKIIIPNASIYGHNEA